VGCYLLFNNSNVELFSPQSQYMGQFTYWGIAGPVGTSLVRQVQAKSGILLLTY
jgi:hypothetical protein